MNRLIWNPIQVTCITPMEDMASYGKISFTPFLWLVWNLRGRLCLDYFIHSHRLLCRFFLH